MFEIKRDNGYHGYRIMHRWADLGRQESFIILVFMETSSLKTPPSDYLVCKLLYSKLHVYQKIRTTLRTNETDKK